MRPILAALLVAAGLFCSSCGGQGGREPGRSVLRVNVTWEPTRDIPSSARSIKVMATVLEPDAGEIVASAVASRPATATSVQLTLEQVPSVKVRLTATAHDSSDGSGNAVASGSAVVQVPEDGSVPATITLTAEAFVPSEALATAAATISYVFPSTGWTLVEGDPDNSQTDVFGTVTATNSLSASRTYEKESDGTRVTVPYSSTASVDRANLQVSAVNAGHGAAQFEDQLVIEDPLKTGETGQVTFVLHATPASPVTVPQVTAEYFYELRIFMIGLEQDPWTVHGFFGEGQGGDPPASGEIRQTFSFLYGRPFSVRLRCTTDVALFLPTFSNSQNISLRITGIEVPSGSTVQSLSGEAWWD